MRIETTGVKDYIRSHIVEIRTLKEVATRIGVSSETLRKDFLRDENIPISEFILNERIKCMKRLLENSELRCYEICSMFGVREDSGEATFKRVVGLSMATYRRLAQEKKPTKACDNRNTPPDEM